MKLTVAPETAQTETAQPRVVALVPAYQEEEIIERTITSLMRQTYPFEYVLVIANNCTDRTVDIVQELQRDKYGEDVLRLVVMEHNPDLKAGALNHGYLMVDPAIDYVFCMDSDTIVDERIIEMGVKKFSFEATTGGICSAYRTLPLKDDATLWERFLWRQQNIEFGLANAWRIENFHSTRVLPGVSSLYRMETLERIRQNHLSNDPTDNTVWVTGSQVEDYDLTLEMKDLGWGAKSSHEMVSWSDVPLKLNGSGGLWRQRKRWYSGTVDTIRKRGLAKHSRYELFSIGLLMLNLVLRALLVVTYVLLGVLGLQIHLVTVFLALPVFASIMQLYRLKYADQLDRWQIFFVATLLVTELYAIYREVLYAYSIWLSYFRPKRAW